jgi:hypothetical protein
MWKLSWINSITQIIERIVRTKVKALVRKVRVKKVGDIQGQN